MKVLVISSMFPNNIQPNFGVFVKQRLLALKNYAQIKVVCPIPYCPIVGGLKRYAYRAKVARRLDHEGLDTYYPRFFSIPMILKPLDGIFYLICLIFFCLRIKKEFDFDIIDAHLAYPDGFAAVILGKIFKVPVAVTLRGHDIFELPKYPVRGRQALYALRKADVVLSVADALGREAVKLMQSPLTQPSPLRGEGDINSSEDKGQVNTLSPVGRGQGEGGFDKVIVASNGVNTDLFYPVNQAEMRKELGLPPDKKIVLSVGHLVVRKGFQYIIEALSILRKQGRADDLYLAIVGASGIEGDYKACLDKLVCDYGLEDYVYFAGAVSYDELYKWYNAADIFCLASSKEGWANVLLEALACGRPVVATNIWGTAEVIASDDLGILVEQGRADALADGLYTALQKEYNSNTIINYAKAHSWDMTAKIVYRQWKKILHKEHTNAG